MNSFCNGRLSEKSHKFSKSAYGVRSKAASRLYISCIVYPKELSTVLLECINKLVEFLAEILEKIQTS